MMSKTDMGCLLKVFARALADSLPRRSAQTPSGRRVDGPAPRAERYWNSMPTDNEYLH
jgi:hypothetical protein